MQQDINTVGHIHSIESFGSVDGPGLRFVVFLQGCPLRCQYCHNPDTWQIGVGKEVTVSEIISQFESVRNFLKSGGLTVTGGEPLVQIDFVTALFKEAKNRGIHTCIDSSGVTFNPHNTEKFDELMKYTDLVMLDIKHIDNANHIKLTGLPNENILAFANYLAENKKEIWIRHVVVPGLTLDTKYLDKLGYFIGGLSSLKAIDVLPYHKMGEMKYEGLGIPYPLHGVPEATKEQAAEAKQVIMAGLMRRIRDDK